MKHQRNLAAALFVLLATGIHAQSGSPRGNRAAPQGARRALDETPELDLRRIVPGLPESYFAWDIASGDTDGDGVPEVVFGAPDFWLFAGDQGRVYLFEGMPDPGGRPDWMSLPGPESANYGYAIEVADVNADGFDDVLVGASGVADGERGEGAVFAYHGSPTGLPTRPSWYFESDEEDRYAGACLAAGDVDGDGCDDLLVAGQDVLFFPGGSGGLSTQPAVTMRDTGAQMVGAGDVNGDGRADFVLLRYAREATLYMGSPSGPIATSWTHNLLGNYHTAAGGGDLNGDGFDDVLIVDGTHGYEHAFVYHGGPGGLGADWHADVRGVYPYAGFALGDSNADGYDDLLVAGMQQSFLFFGGPQGIPKMCSPITGLGPECADELIPGLVQGTLYDYFSASFAGDLDGDGREDFVLGSPGLYYGTSAGLHFYGQTPPLQQR